MQLRINTCIFTSVSPHIYHRCKILRLEEKHHQLETRYNEKTTQYSVIAKCLDELKDESTRTLSRVKERSESTRHYLQTQIAELERQMVSCRAQCRSYQKERDEVSILATVFMYSGRPDLISNHFPIILPIKVFS